MVKKLIALPVLWIVGGLAFSLLQACYSGNASQTTNEKKQPVQVTPKPGATVNIRNSQPILLDAVGEQNVVIILHSPSYPGAMSVSVAASDGVSIVSELAPLVYQLTETGEYRVPLKLNVEREGRHYVRLNVSVTSNGLSEKRVVSAILQVGAARTKLQKAVPAGTSDAVISLPAQERVSPRE